MFSAGSEIALSSNLAPEPTVHGADVDKGNQVVHFGARHMLLRDGLWMQPEPLSYLGVWHGSTASPLGYGPTYAAGNSLTLADRSGNSPLVNFERDGGGDAGAPTPSAEQQAQNQAIAEVLVGLSPWGPAADVVNTGSAVKAYADGTGPFLDIPVAGMGFLPVVGDSAKAAVRMGKLKAKAPTGSGWFPDRTLPRDKNGVPVPDSEYPHTQLGTKEGRSETYGQAREFDADGNPVKDIDFTDHGRADHTNPHQHEYLENETGGTPKRGPAEPLEVPE